MSRLSQEQAIDNLVSIFEKEVTDIVQEARGNTVRFLQDRLKTTDGVIDRTQANARLLQSVEQQFKVAMDKAGYGDLVNEYVNAFNGQFVYFSDVVEQLGEQIGRNLTFTFGDRDKKLFLQQQGQAKDMLQQAVDIQAKAAQQQAMFNIGGVRAADLTKMIAEKLDMSAGRASAIADTSLSTFYRTVADRGYQQIEAQLGKDVQLLYKYGGPRDKLTRPKCREWLAGTAEKGWTRKQIEGLSNGQLPNVFLTGGGFRCRHQWIAVARVKDAAEPKQRAPKGMPAGLGDLAQIEWVIAEGQKYRKELSKSPFMQKLNRDLKKQQALADKLKAKQEEIDKAIHDSYQVVDGMVVSKNGAKLHAKSKANFQKFCEARNEVYRLQRQIGDNVVLKIQPAEGWKLPEYSQFSSKEWQEGVRDFERLVGPIKNWLFEANGGPAVFGRFYADYGDRSYYDSKDNHRVSLGIEAGPRTVVHELGHWLDDTRPDIGRLSRKFLEYRTKDEPLLKLADTFPDHGYKDYEVYRKDKFMKEYMGKFYSDQSVTHPDGTVHYHASTEITSMGLEYLHSNAGHFMSQDPEYFDFMMGLIRLARTSPVQFDPWGVTK